MGAQSCQQFHIFGGHLFAVYIALNEVRESFNHMVTVLETSFGSVSAVSGCVCSISWHWKEL